MVFGGWIILSSLWQVKICPFLNLYDINLRDETEMKYRRYLITLLL